MMMYILTTDGAKKSRAACHTIAVCLLLCALLGGCGRKKTELIWESGDSAATLGVESSLDSYGRNSAEQTDWQEASGKNAAEHDKRQDASESQTGAWKIYVYVCGAVNTPGVVELPTDSRADDAVTAAGGLTEAADRNYVNLAAKVSDGEKLLIPTREEAATLEQEIKEAESGLVNINTANVAALCTLPGIGESRAGDIIAYRERNGEFQVIEDIMKVAGIKTSTFEKIREKIAVK